LVFPSVDEINYLNKIIGIILKYVLQNLITFGSTKAGYEKKLITNF